MASLSLEKTKETERPGCFPDSLLSGNIGGLLAVARAGSWLLCWLVCWLVGAVLKAPWIEDPRAYALLGVLLETTRQLFAQPINSQIKLLLSWLNVMLISNISRGLPQEVLGIAGMF